jgi:hypothetical protein
MSEAVIGFQLAIIITILIATAYSEEARATVIGLWVLETFIFVWFLSPLMFLQLGTITIMYFVTDEFYREVIKEILITVLRYVLAIGLLITLAVVVYNSYFKDDSPVAVALTPEQACSQNGNLWEFDNLNSQWKCTYFYSLNIVTTPEDARVQIMNIKPKYYDGIRLRPGRYTMRVSKPGYHTENFYIDFQDDSTYVSNLQKK